MSVITKNIKVIVLEIPKHFKARYKSMWVTNAKVRAEGDDFQDGIYTLAIFDRNVEYKDGEVVKKEPLIKENQLIKLEKFTYNAPTQYSIEGTIGEIKLSPSDIEDQLQNPVFVEEDTEEIVQYEPEEIIEVVSLKSEIQELKNQVAEINAIKERSEREKHMIEEEISEKQLELSEIRSQIMNLRGEKNEIMRENWEDTIEVVKALCEFLPEEYDRIQKIMIDVREMKRNHRTNAILIKKEGM